MRSDRQPIKPAHIRGAAATGSEKPLSEEALQKKMERFASIVSHGTRTYNLPNTADSASVIFQLLNRISPLGRFSYHTVTKPSSHEIGNNSIFVKTAAKDSGPMKWVYVRNDKGWNRIGAKTVAFFSNEDILNELQKKEGGASAIFIHKVTFVFGKKSNTPDS